MIRWFAAPADGGVVQASVLLGDEDRLAAHLDHQRLGRGPEHPGRGHPEACAAQPVHVVAAAGERHHRMQGQRERALAYSRLEHRHAVPPAGVGQHPALQRRPGRREPGDQAGQRIVGHGQQGQVGAAEDLAGFGDHGAGEVRARPAQRGVGDRGRGHDLVTGPGQGRAERGARPAGADDADREPGRAPGGRGGFRVHCVIRIVMTKAPGRNGPGAPAATLATYLSWRTCGRASWCSWVPGTAS